MEPADDKASPPSPDCDDGRGVFGRLRSRLDCYRRDVDAVLAHDPAARSRTEVVLAYPGLHALWLHRTAHALWGRERHLAARVLSHANRFLTGIEIHPGATIGRGVFIDHGMGVVIGETARVGDGTIIFKGVVLGGTRTDPVIRHPQVGAHCVIGTNACILGNIQVGDRARIGSGSVVIRDVPPDATVVGVPGRVIPPKGDRRAHFDATLDHASLPDPTAEMLRSLRDENDRLRRRLERLEAALDITHEPDEADEHLVDGELATQDLPSRRPVTGG